MNRYLLSVIVLGGVSLGAFLHARNLSPEAELLLLKEKMMTVGDERAVETVKKAPGVFNSAADIKAFIRVVDDETVTRLEEAGCTVNSRVGDIVTVSMPLGILADVAQISGVERVETSRKVNLTNNAVRRKISVNPVHYEEHPDHGDLPGQFRGDGVIVGMVDVGFEFNHLAFRSYDGEDRLRISRVWNQNGYGRHPEGFTYGAEYTTPEEIRAAKADYNEFHGTHTATTAAGSPAGSPYYGMAPEAEIVLVSVNLNEDSNITDAVKYIFDYAEEQGKPCVVNMSLGSHNGPHDGTSLLDRSFEELTGPGKILVGSAGNEAIFNMHASKVLTEDDNVLKTMIAYADPSNKSSYTYLWATPGKKITVEVAIVDPLRKGRIIKSTGEVSMDAPADYYTITEGTVTDLTMLFSPMVNGDGGASQMIIESTVMGLADNRKEAIIVHGEPGTTVHLWQAANNNYFINGGIDDFTDGDNFCTVGEIGGTSDAVISVGSYDSDAEIEIPSVGTLRVDDMMSQAGYNFQPGDRSFFSSRGPTADGRMKPDVTAPGNLVASGFNKYCTASHLAVDYLPAVTDASGEKYYFELTMGTSQAAPSVTGTVALWLQANPELTPADVRDILSKTCDRDAFTGAEPNNDFGFGKLNAYAGIKKALEYTSVNEIEGATDDATVWYDKAEQRIYCATASAVTATVYTLTGTPVLTGKITPVTHSIDASGLAPGVHIVTLTSAGSTKSHKLLIR